jgi:hypothetical protein
MRGSPRSLFLSAANRAAMWWTAATKAAMQRSATAAMKAAMKPPRAKAVRRHRKKA